MNEVQIFSDGNIDLQVKEVDGQVYLDAEAAAIGLGLYQTKNGKRYVRWTTVSKYLSQQVGNNYPLVGKERIVKGDWITEQQFYKLAFKANNDVSERFQDWVAGEVLPAIRKHGAYMTDQKAFDVVNNKSGLIDLLQQAADQLKEKDLKIEEMKPKALFADSVSASESTILIRELAKILKGNGIDIGEKRLYQWLREKNYLISYGSDRNTPTQMAMNLGIFKVKETPIIHNGMVTIQKTTMVTGKGQQYFVNKFLKLKHSGEY